MRDTEFFGLLYQGGEEALVLRGYCDAGVTLYQQCTSGWVLTFGGAAVSWRSNRQQAPSSSSASAELRAAVEATKEIIWLRYLLEFLLAPQPAVPLFCDNSSAVKAMMKNGGGVKDLKELSQYLPYMRGQIAQGEVEARFIPGTCQPADFLTKSLLGPQLDRCRSAVGMRRLNVTTGQPPLTHCLALRAHPCVPSSSDDQATPSVSRNEDWESVMSTVANLE